MLKNIKLIAISLICISFASAGVQAQSWPNKPITLVVPTAPGGTTDFSARLVADSMSKTLGVPVTNPEDPAILAINSLHDLSRMAIPCS
jgi:tripartite-type tricarboxylate transporter receptor subunit TctC